MDFYFEVFDMSILVGQGDDMKSWEYILAEKLYLCFHSLAYFCLLIRKQVNGEKLEGART